MIFGNKKLLFRLELNGRLICEISSDDFQSDITIGRSEENSWVLPADDRGASSRHARITRKGKAFYIQDTGSRNGIYFQGKKISERKLAVGDIISIGDCKLVVEQVVEKNSGTVEQFHKFEQLSGAEKGRIYRLENDHIKIGSAKGCTIVIDDSLVSHIHAVIENHSDGSCWVKDMGSRNGTKVNGSLLTEENMETGRMLKDGDIISIAYVDFRFWDRTVLHIRSHLLLKIGVVAATLALAIGGYFAFQTVSPSAKSIRLKAEEYAAMEDFESARKMLQSASEARGADADIIQRQELTRKLAIWEDTFNTWNQVRNLLSGKSNTSNLYKANSLFAKLISGNRESWQWNTATGSVEMKKAYDTQILLSTLLNAEDWMNDPDDDILYLKTLEANLTAAVTGCEKNPQSYQRLLIDRSRDLIGEMQQEIKEYEATQKTMASYQDVADTARVIAELEKISAVASERFTRREKSGMISSRSVIDWCGKLLAPLKKLHRSQLLLEANYVAVANFEFSKFKENISLPSSEECIISANLPNRRADMENSNARLQKLLLQLKNYQLYFHNHNLDKETDSALLALIFDEKIWEQVLDCDCLKSAQPLYSEKNWRSNYDRVLGVYVFWEYLRSLDGEFDTTIYEERFKPEMFRSKEIFNHLEVFTAFCEPVQRMPFYNDITRLKAVNNGKTQFVEHYQIAADILKRRDELVKRLYNVQQSEPDSRRGIIAGGAALYLAAEKNDILPDDFAQKLNDSVKELRKKVAALSQQSINTTPEQVISRSKQIMEIGIPGDSFIKQPWTDFIKRK